MSDQTTREAAARVFLATSRSSDDEDVFGVVIDVAGGGWFLPNGVDSDKYGLGWDDIIGAWAFHVRALDAANAAPVAPDPLEGVVWRSPWAVYAFYAIIGGGPLMHPDDTDVLDSAAKGVAADVIAAHARAQLDAAATECADAGYYARAQLAREAKAPTHTDLMLPPEAIDAWLEHNPPPVETAPVAPAVTLDAAREVAKAHGYRLVHESGHDDPSAVLAALIVGASLSEDDAMTVTMALSSEEHARAGIARLRALGVTPAALS